MIVILGSSGSGKTWLATKLKATTSEHIEALQDLQYPDLKHLEFDAELTRVVIHILTPQSDTHHLAKIHQAGYRLIVVQNQTEDLTEPSPVTSHPVDYRIRFGQENLDGLTRLIAC
jgi:uridine kinase